MGYFNKILIYAALNINYIKYIILNKKFMNDELKRFY